MNKSLQGLCAYFAGHQAEDFARKWLETKGYHFVAKNLKNKRGSGAGELDLIMTDKKTLVFIEVKKRKNINDALECISPKMQQRLYKGAAAFLAQNPNFQDWDCRFDAVCIADDTTPVLIQNVIEDA